MDVTSAAIARYGDSPLAQHASYKYVRRLGQRYQARLRFATDPSRDTHLGLYKSSWAAKRAISAVVRAIPPGSKLDLVAIWRATLVAQQLGKVLPHILPKYVFLVRGDPGDPPRYQARLRHGKQVWVKHGLYFNDPEDALREALFVRDNMIRLGSWTYHFKKARSIMVPGRKVS